MWCRTRQWRRRPRASWSCQTGLTGFGVVLSVARAICFRDICSIKLDDLTGAKRKGLMIVPLSLPHTLTVFCVCVCVCVCVCRFRLAQEEKKTKKEGTHVNL